MRRALTPFVVVLSVLAASAVAAEPITIGETYTLESKVMGETRTVLVSTPAGYGRSGERFPVLFMTDGDAHLSHTRGTVDFLVRNGLMPDVIVVGVTNTDRTRDLTPTHAFRERDDGSREEIVNSGGAARFLDFFERELIPWVDATYRTQPMRILAGHSYGGLFTLYALASRPALFQAHLAASPSLNFDDDFILKTLEGAFKGKSRLDRDLFVTMANEEDGDPAPTRLERLRSLLASGAPEGLLWETRHFPDEDHGSVVLRSHYWGLRHLFAGWRLPSGEDGRGFDGTADDIRAHFAKLSARHGFDIVPPEGAVNRLGYQALGRGDLERSIGIFRYNAEVYPESANVHDSLGEALETAGRLEHAHASYWRAVKNAEKNGDDRLEVFARNRDRVAAALAQQGS